LVESSRRNRGIGGELLAFACDHAKEQDIPTLYAATAAASTLFMREGWSMIDKGSTDRGCAVDIFAKTLAC
jgi:N-acetylglutamate synthase-like GNAT family acetyltransferase